MTSRLRVALVGRDPEFFQELRLRLIGWGHQVILPVDGSGLLGLIYSDPPDLAILDLTRPEPEIQAVIVDLKKDSFTGTIPLIGILAEASSESFDWSACPLDDFLRHPVHYPELLGRIALSLQRMQRILDRNPLTRLPGNTSIQQAIAIVIGKPMAVCYLDINQFKPYNDTFGFIQGDEALRMVGRIIANTVREIGGGGFVGHVGGDDFIFIVPREKAGTVCEAVIRNFNVVVADLFGEEDKARGYYLAKDRKGDEQKTLLPGIAIAVVLTDIPGINHAGRVAEVAAELKLYAKMSAESRYVIDRRKEYKERGRP